MSSTVFVVMRTTYTENNKIYAVCLNEKDAVSLKKELDDTIDDPESEYYTIEEGEMIL